MVVCIVALVVLGVLSIFSAKYRPMAKEAALCVGRMVTLRPCQQQFDEKIRAKVTTKVATKSTRAAGFVYRNFKVISWIFVIAFVLSTAYTVYGLYNYATYGSCDPSTPNGCVYDAISDSFKSNITNKSCTPYFAPLNSTEPCFTNMTDECPS